MNIIHPGASMLIVSPTKRPAGNPEIPWTDQSKGQKQSRQLQTFHPDSSQTKQHPNMAGYSGFIHLIFRKYIDPLYSLVHVSILVDTGMFLWATIEFCVFVFDNAECQEQRKSFCLPSSEKILSVNTYIWSYMNT